MRSGDDYGGLHQQTRGKALSRTLDFMKPEKKNMKCNIIAYSAPESHQVRPASLKTFEFSIYASSKVK